MQKLIQFFKLPAHNPTSEEGSLYAKENLAESFEKPLAAISKSQFKQYFTSYLTKLQLSSKSNEEHTEISAFTAIKRPSVDLESYFQRIYKYMECSDSCYILALIYIKRIQAKGIAFDRLTKHRLLLVSVLAAVKFIEDSFYQNEYYAQVGGINLKELNNMEQQFY